MMGILLWTGAYVACGIAASLLTCVLWYVSNREYSPHDAGSVATAAFLFGPPVLALLLVLLLFFFLERNFARVLRRWA